MLALLKERRSRAHGIQKPLAIGGRKLDGRRRPLGDGLAQSRRPARDHGAHISAGSTPKTPTRRGAAKSRRQRQCRAQNASATPLSNGQGFLAALRWRRGQLAEKPARRPVRKAPSCAAPVAPTVANSKLKQSQRRGKQTRSLAREKATASGQADKKRASQKMNAAAVAEMVGPASETREQHLARHCCPDVQKQCPRCRFYAHGHKWMQAYGSSERHQLGSRARQRCYFVQERSTSHEGPWGLGCYLCADLLQRNRMNLTHCEKTKVRRLAGKWARFEIRTASLHSEHLRKHVASAAHRLAILAFQRPESPPVLLLQATHSDEVLLQGAVPQPADWLRTWRAVMCPIPDLRFDMSWPAFGVWNTQYVGCLMCSRCNHTAKRKVIH